MKNHWLAWHDAVGRSEIDQAIRALYADLDQAVAERQPICNASGRCCRFETFGHRLYVTGLEIAWFLQGVADLSATPCNAPSALGDLQLQQLGISPGQSTRYDGCLYQVDGLCSTHVIRPLGCRTFFCEEGTEAWQQDTTEHFLDRLKQLHVAHELPYSYMEWRTGLAEAKNTFGLNEPRP